MNDSRLLNNWSMDALLDQNVKYDEKIFYNCSNYFVDNVVAKSKKIINENNPYIIGYSGSIVYYEGIYEAIIAIEELIKETKLNIEVHILGNISNIISEENGFGLFRYSDLINKSFVKIIPKVSHDKVKDIQSTFDLYMIPRLDLPVTNIVSPIKPFEPMALKIPLIMSDCLCLNKISKNGKNCITFKKNDFDDFKSRVLYIINNGYDEELLENAYNFVKNERSWERMIENIGLYELV
jgi:glycosyltransferase involved in cell wall biosynthesis